MAKEIILSRTTQKLDAAERMLNYDKEVSAGIYVYALEELGKLEVLKQVKKNLLNYKEEFTNHTFKFRKAKEHLNKVDHS